MKRLFKFFTVAAIIAVGFTGCSSETPLGTEDGPDGSGVVKGRGAETYATFRILEGTNAATRASNLASDGATNEATTISKIRLIFYDSDNLLEFDTLISSNVTTATVKLTSGSKQLYILTNETTGINTLISGINQFGNFNGVLNLDASNDGIADLDNIGQLYGPQIVSNTTGAGPKGSEIVLTGNITETESQDGTSPNNITIELQRSVAKVFVSQSGPVSPQTKILTIDSAAIIAHSGASAPTYQLWNVLASHKPFQEIAGTQIRSPHYDAPVGTDWGAIYARNTTPAFTNATAIGTSPTPTADKAFYVTENTPQIPRSGNSTYAAIKTTATPTRNHYISALNFNDLNGGQFTGTKAGADATPGVTYYVLDSLQDLVTTAVGLTNKTVFAGTDALRLARKAVYHLLNPGIQQLGTLAGYDAVAITTAIGTNWDKYIHTYTDGVAYYRLNIGSVTGTTLKPEVIRNHFYQLNIDNYKVLGVATVGELLGDEDEEITSETYLTVTITIEDWIDVQNGQDI
jgi:hypothetical protein